MYSRYPSIKVSRMFLDHKSDVVEVRPEMIQDLPKEYYSVFVVTPVTKCNALVTTSCVKY